MQLGFCLEGKAERELMNTIALVLLSVIGADPSDRQKAFLMDAWAARTDRPEMREQVQELLDKMTKKQLAGLVSETKRRQIAEARMAMKQHRRRFNRPRYQPRFFFQPRLWGFSWYYG